MVLPTLRALCGHHNRNTSSAKTLVRAPTSLKRQVRSRKEVGSLCFFVFPRQVPALSSGGRGGGTPAALISYHVSYPFISLRPLSASQNSQIVVSLIPRAAEHAAELYPLAGLLTMRMPSCSRRIATHTPRSYRRHSPPLAAPTPHTMRATPRNRAHAAARVHRGGVQPRRR